MTNEEFKAWFEGFTECMESTPTPKQWERIKKRVTDINNTPVLPLQMYMPRSYWPSANNIYYCSQTTGAMTEGATKTPEKSAVSSVDTMYALGKVEFKDV